MKECQIPKTKGHRLEGFLDSTTKVHQRHHLSKVMYILEVVAEADRSTPAAAWVEDAQESADQAAVVEHTPFLVARLGYNDYPLVRPSQSSDRVLAGRYTDVDNDVGSLVAGLDNAAGGWVVVEEGSQIQSLRRETQRPWSPISEQ